jgi:hypothetical protein
MDTVPCVRKLAAAHRRRGETLVGVYAKVVREAQEAAAATKDTAIASVSETPCLVTRFGRKGGMYVVHLNKHYQREDNVPTKERSVRLGWFDYRNGQGRHVMAYGYFVPYTLPPTLVPAPAPV